MSIPVKIVISGPVGAGKTTFIRAISETEVVDTDAVATEDIGKPTTTVAFDFGSRMIEDYQILLFGTPGQERFSYMWDILCENAVGLLMLVAGDKPGEFPHARHILEFITSQIPIPFIIGVTRQDCPRVWDAEDVADYFQVPAELVCGLDGRDERQCMATLYELFAVINRKAGL